VREGFMGLTSHLEKSEILFHDGTFRERDILGKVSDDVPPLLCKNCTRVWVMGRDSLGLLDRVTSALFPQTWAAFEVAKTMSRIAEQGNTGVACPFCKAEEGFAFDSPRVVRILKRKREEWFSCDPVRWDETTRYSFGFRSGFTARALREFAEFVARNWHVASWHFAEGHFEPWLRAIGRKDLATIMQSSKILRGNGREGFDHWLGRLKEYRAVWNLTKASNP
jgi:hypothetical protein